MLFAYFQKSFYCFSKLKYLLFVSTILEQTLTLKSDGVAEFGCKHAKKFSRKYEHKLILVVNGYASLWKVRI